MQHRAKHLLGQIAEVFQFQNRRGHVSAVSIDVAWNLQLGDFGCHRAFALDVFQQALLRFGINHRAHVHIQLMRTANVQFFQAAFEHFNHTLGDVVLHTQHTQCRAALTRRIKCRQQHVLHHLLRQGGAVYNHRILATCFGQKQRHVAAFGQGAVNQLRHFGRTREEHACNAWVGG